LTAHSLSFLLSRPLPIFTLFPYTTLFRSRLLTYPRTDSKYITSDMEGSTKELITGLCAALPFMQGVKLQADLARICDNSKVTDQDRKSTRLNSSHVSISYAVFCLKTKKDS